MKRNPSPPLIQVRNLSVHRGTKRILRHIDWTIFPGEHWVILGANGSGKTSLLSVLTGYLFPTEGEVMVLGERFGESDWRDLRKHVGLVSSSIRNRIDDSERVLDMVVSGKEAVINSCKRPTPSERKEAKRILQLTECEDLSSQPWGVLSQGERQRVLIGRALMANPKLLILDEPCAGLDPVARVKFLRFTERLVKTPRPPTLLFVTHHIEEISGTFSHLLMIRQGSVLSSGPVKECLNSELLSRLFNTPVRIGKSRGQYMLAVLPDRNVAR